MTMGETTENGNDSKAELQTATLAGGCFWCLEAVFLELKGVKAVVSGYTGGKTINPSYREISSGTTGHAEAVQVTFDPAEISFQDIIEVFFTIHDPTTLNRQGADKGTQYRSAVFFNDDGQSRIIQEVMDEVEKSAIWKDPLVTEVTPLNNFYKAEEYHQNYYKQNSEQAYCRLVIDPKVAKFRKQFIEKLKKI